MNVPPILHTGVPRRVLASGLLGTTMLSIGGIGAGAVPRYKDAVAGLLHLEWVHDNATGRGISVAVVLIGVVLLATAWWSMRNLLDQLSPRAVLFVAGLWSIPLLLAPPLFSRDLYAYAGQGNLVAHGIDPYTYGPGALFGKWAQGVDDVWRYSPSPYGPVFLWLAGAIVRLTGDHVVPAVLLLRLLAVSGLLLTAWALPRLARAHGVAPQRALWLGLANPFVLLHGVGGAHNDALMVGLLVCGLAILGHEPGNRRLAVATVLITVAALVKLPAIAALAFLPLMVPGWAPRVRAALVVAATATVTAVVLTSSSGLGWGWLHTLDGGSARLSIFSPVTGIGVLTGELLHALGVVDTPDVVIRLVLAAGLAGAGLAALWLLLRAGKLGPMRALGLAMVAVVTLAPVVQPWYLLWGLVLLAAVGGERVLLALGALSFALSLSLMPNGRSLVRPPLYGLPVLAAGALAVFEVRRSTKRALEQAPAVTPTSIRLPP